MRDIPLLLQLLFWYALLQGLPAPRSAWQIGGAVFLSNRGIKLPVLDWEPAHTLGRWSPSLLGLVGTIAVEPPRATRGRRRPA